MQQQAPISKKGIDYIINSDKYPFWLKEHKVFKELNKIDKIFPKIGLPNIKEDCEILNTAEAKSEGSKLGQKLISEVGKFTRELYTKLDIALQSTEKNRNETCAKLQSAIDIMNSFSRSMGFADYMKVLEGKVVLQLRADIFAAGNAKPVFRKNEGIIRVAGKIWEMAESLGLKTTKIDALQDFKNFSRVNVPNKKYKLVFSSHGEEGAWDIGTISMRGVQSCQSWNAPQSRGLIGSISSKFVGVIYLASDQNIPGFGCKMLNRSMVRFVINTTTRRPALVVDRMYPNYNEDTARSFVEFLQRKTGLDVISTDKNQELSRYYLPEEAHAHLYRVGEASYADHPINVKKHEKKIKIDAKIKSLTDMFKTSVYLDLDKMFLAKKEAYNIANTRLAPLKTEYETAKKKWEEDNKDKPEEEKSKFELEEPKMEEQLASFGRGGVINLFAHCDKKYGANKSASTFAKLILDSVEVDMNCSSQEEYHRKYLMAFLKQREKIKEIAKDRMKKGTWTRSFPKSSERFFDNIFGEMKSYFVSSAKEMIKQKGN